MNIGLLGFGVVGRGVYDITSQRSDMQVKKVICLEEISLPDAEVTRDFPSLLADDSIDTVVEAMGGLHPAYEFVRAAILAGKNIVTSNKALVAHFYDDLIPLAEEKGVKFRCTAAVGGGIGWLSEVERARRSQKITQVGGIVNGTCNFILDAMTSTGQDYAEALKTAQSLGYAEANPSTDVEGIDTYHKLVLSSNIGFGISLDGATVPVAGINTIEAQGVAAFRERNYVCKLVCTGSLEGNSVQAYVQPTLFPVGAPESAIPKNYNLITLIGSASGRMSFFGQGAGRYPTAYNVLQDCVDILNGKGFYCGYGKKMSAKNTAKIAYYVRGEQDAWLKANTKETWGAAVLTQPVAVEEMHAWRKEHPGAFIAAVPENTL